MEYLILIIELAIIALLIAGMWKTYEKAGKPGWAAIIPIYNIWVLAEIAGKPGWWALLCLIPIVNIVVLIILYVGVAQAFGKSGGFAVGLIFLGFIFWPMLGFGDAQYGGAKIQPRGFAPIMPGSPQ